MPARVRSSRGVPGGGVAAIASRLGYYVPSPIFCFSDAGGTVPCALTDPIRVWKCSLGVGPDFAQATLGWGPTLEQVGGRWVARSSGIGSMQATGGTTYVSEFGWAGNAAGATWSSFGGFLNPVGGGRWCLTSIGGTAMHNDPFPRAVQRNGVALTSPFDAVPITSPMTLQIRSANQGLTPAGWLFGDADALSSFPHAWDCYGFAAFSADLTAGEQATVLASLQALYA